MADGGTDAAVLALVGALGGVLLTGTIGLVTAALNQRWTERARAQAAGDARGQARHDELLATCHAYLVAANRFYHVLARQREGEQVDARGAAEVMQDSYMLLTIIAPAQIRSAARAYNTAQYALERRVSRDDFDEQVDKVDELREQLRAAVRAALGVGD